MNWHGSTGHPPRMARRVRRGGRAAVPRPYAYAFVHTYTPVMDDEPYRSWESTAEYRRWCDENLPDWLGYGTD